MSQRLSNDLSPPPLITLHNSPFKNSKVCALAVVKKINHDTKGTCDRVIIVTGRSIQVCTNKCEVRRYIDMRQVSLVCLQHREGQPTLIGVRVTNEHDLAFTIVANDTWNTHAGKPESIAEIIRQAATVARVSMDGDAPPEPIHTTVVPPGSNIFTFLSLKKKETFEPPAVTAARMKKTLGVKEVPNDSMRKKVASIFDGDSSNQQVVPYPQPTSPLLRPESPATAASKKYTISPVMEAQRPRLERFYECHNPSKKSDIDRILANSTDPEELFRSLVEQYGPEPPPITPPTTGVDLPPTEATNRSTNGGDVARSLDDTSSSHIPSSEMEAARPRLVRFYKHYNPKKLVHVDTVLAQAPSVSELFDELVKTYGPEPPITPQTDSLYTDPGSPTTNINIRTRGVSMQLTPSTTTSQDQDPRFAYTSATPSAAPKPAGFDDPIDLVVPVQTLRPRVIARIDGSSSPTKGIDIPGMKSVNDLLSLHPNASPEFLPFGQSTKPRNLDVKKNASWVQTEIGASPTTPPQEVIKMRIEPDAQCSATIFYPGTRAYWKALKNHIDSAFGAHEGAQCLVYASHDPHPVVVSRQYLHCYNQLYCEENPHVVSVHHTDGTWNFFHHSQYWKCQPTRHGTPSNAISGEHPNLPTYQQYNANVSPSRGSRGREASHSQSLLLPLERGVSPPPAPWNELTSMGRSPSPQQSYVPKNANSNSYSNNNMRSASAGTSYSAANGGGYWSCFMDEWERLQKLQTSL